MVKRSMSPLRDRDMSLFQLLALGTSGTVGLGTVGAVVVQSGSDPGLFGVGVAPGERQGCRQPSRPAASCNGCSWLSTVWPLSLVETRTYRAARLVDGVARRGDVAMRKHLTDR